MSMSNYNNHRSGRWTDKMEARKCLVFSILVGILLLVLPIVAGAATIDSGKCGDNLSWTLDDEGLLTISGSGEMTSHPWDASLIRQVIIEEGSTNIRNSAFENCANLVKVTIPNSVTKIDKYAFSGCSSLTSITIPDNVSIIGICAFGSSSMELHASINSSAAKALSKASYSFNPVGTPYYLKYLYSEDEISGLEIIKCNKNITSLIIPEGVTDIGRSAFEYCNELTSIVLPDGLKSIGNWAFSGCNSLNNITLPDTLTSIGGRAFYGCSNLDHIILPDSVDSIGQSAFGYYTETIKVFASMDSVAAHALSKANHGFRLSEYPYDLMYLYSDNEVIGLEVSNCDKDIVSISIPHGVTSLGERAFYKCKSLKSIILPEGLKSIGEDAFYDCISLTDITIPEGVTSIGEDAFNYCTSLKSIIIPESVSTIGKNAFCNCQYLTYVKMPTHLTEIPDGAFWCCDLRSLTIPNSVTSIGDYAFCWCEHLSDITIPENVTSLGNYSFAYCKGIKGITIPDSVTHIGESAFAYCTFSSIIIPPNVIRVENRAFSDNDNFRKITILGQNTELGLNLFQRYDINVYCYEGSSAETWADNQGYNTFLIGNLLPEDDFAVEIPIRYFRLGCGYSKDLHGTIFPFGDPTTIKWDIDDPNIVSLENGIVTALSEGTATITATYGNSSCSVTVVTYNSPTKIILETTEQYATVNYSVRVPAYTCIPENSTTYLTWEYEFQQLEDETYGSATYTNSFVSADYPCNVIMHATSSEGLTAECIAHFYYPVTKIKFDQEELNIPVGADHQLFANVIMRNQSCINRFITFSSSDETIATVDENGKVHTLNAGDVTITATSQSNKSASVIFHVITPCETHVPVIDPYDPATCSATGKTEGSHCAVCGKILIEQAIIPIQDHDWSNVKYVWSDDCSSVTATRYCGPKKDHIETETVGTYYKLLQPATCEVPGITRFTSDQFMNPAFSRQTTEKSQLGDHNWGAPEYEWADDCSTATAFRVCTVNAAHKDTETKSSELIVTKSPTNNKPGSVTCRVVFENAVYEPQEKEKAIPALKDMNTLYLPAQLTAIEDQAFSGVICEAVIIPDSCEQIGSDAFADCLNLKYVWIPKSIDIANIADTAFEGCNGVILDYEQTQQEE